MSCSTFGSAKCFGQKEILAKSVRQFNDTHKSSAVITEKPATKPTTGPIAAKMELLVDVDNKARNKFVRMWQHLISQSSAPVARSRGAFRK